MKPLREFTSAQLWLSIVCISFVPAILSALWTFRRGCEELECFLLLVAATAEFITYLVMTFSLLAATFGLPRVHLEDANVVKLSMVLIAQDALGVLLGTFIPLLLRMVKSPALQFVDYISQTMVLQIIMVVLVLVVGLWLIRRQHLPTARVLRTLFLLSLVVNAAVYTYADHTQKPELTARQQAQREQESSGDLSKIIEHAVEQDNPELCQQIYDSAVRNNCVSNIISDRAVAAKDVALCKTIPRPDWKSGCYRNVAIATQDTTLCEKADIGRDDCIRTIAIQTGNLDLCERVLEFKNGCYSMFAQRLNRSDACLRIPLTAGNTQYNCIVGTALRIEDCSPLPTGEWRDACIAKVQEKAAPTPSA